MPLIIIALILILLDALITRTGWKLPLPAIGKRNQKTLNSAATTTTVPAKSSTPPNPQAAPAKQQKTVQSPEPKLPESSRSSRFDRAKRKK